jgi:hypothetical protein
MIGSLGIPFRGLVSISFTVHRVEVSDDGDENDEIVFFFFKGRKFGSDEHCNYKEAQNNRRTLVGVVMVYENVSSWDF